MRPPKIRQRFAEWRTRKGAREGRLAVPEETHRGIFAAMGVALVVGGLGIIATAIGISATAAPGRSLTPAFGLGVLGAVAVFGGFLVFAGALTTTRYLPLPGKTAILAQRAEAASRLERSEWAKTVLVQATNQGRVLYLDPNVGQVDAIMWGNNALNFVMQVWGLQQASLINNATPPAHLVPGASLHEGWIGPTLRQLLQLVERSHDLPLAASGLAMTKNDYDVWHFRFGGLIAGETGTTRTPSEVAGLAPPVANTEASPPGGGK